MVDHLVGLSPSNHGTIDPNAVCLATCAPSVWQQRPNVNFIAAVNSYQETFPGISYTDIYTDTDEVVVPNIGPAASSALHGGGGEITNVAIQQVCPLDPTEHIGVGIYDNTAFQIAIEALTHSGPGDPWLVPKSVCSQLLMPGVNPAAFPVNYLSTLETVATTLATYPIRHLSRRFDATWRGPVRAIDPGTPRPSGLDGVPTNALVAVLGLD